MPIGNRLAFTLVSSLLALSIANMAPAQEFISASSDVTTGLAGGGLARDHDVIVKSPQTIAWQQSLGGLPESSAVTAYSLGPNTFRYVAFETTTLLPGGTVARPGDVALSKDDGPYALIFDASAAGVPDGIQTDAFSITRANAVFVLSFDTTVALPGGVVAADEDLVSWSVLDGFQLAFDGSAAGVPRALDIDAAHDLGRDEYLVSFDTSGALGGIAFDDEDVLRWDGSAWSLYTDGSAESLIAGGADLDALAVPEPRLVTALGIAVLALGAAWRKKV